MTTPQVVARVQLEHAQRTVRRLTLPGQRDASGAVVVGACLVCGAVLAVVGLFLN